MNGVAFYLVVYTIARDCCCGAFNLSDETIADSASAHVTAGRALLCKILSVVDVCLYIEA